MSKTTNFNMHADKIEKINQGLWTIKFDQFSVSFVIQEFIRTLNQNELRALKTQIQLSIANEYFKKIKKMIKNSKIEYQFTEKFEKANKNSDFFLEAINKENIKLHLAFLYRYYKIKKYKNIIQYFNHQGINQFSEIDKQRFEDIQNQLEIFDENIYLNQKSFSFSLHKLQSTTFRTIGNYIQDLELKNKDDTFNQLKPYLNAISGQITTSDSFYQKAKDFLEEMPNDTIFDSAKLGYGFCNYILSPPNVEFKTLTNQSEDSYQNSIIDTIPDLKRSVQDAFYSKNLLFFKVYRPSHCYHCIKSLPKLLTINKKRCVIYFNEKSLIFCKNGGNFAEQIQEIPKSSVKDSESLSSSSVYFIIHPETLNDEDYSLLEEFISTRICYVNDTDLPKVVIISTLDFEKNLSIFSTEFREIQFNINDGNEIEALYNLSLDPKYDFSPYSFYLYKSEIPGLGKTYQIHEKMTKIQNDEDIKCKPASLFIDANMKYLPSYIQNSEIVHFDLSPEIFDEKFEFFDELWIFCNLFYHLLPNGENIRTPKHLFFEVPTLTKNQHFEGGSIRAADFPIAISNIVDVKSSDTKVLLSNEVRNLCEKVFRPINGRNLIYTSDLLKVSLEMFYPSLFDDSSNLNFDLRIINETNLFLNYFCKYLKLDSDENIKLSQAIFLLLLRTNFHVWTMDNIFKNKQPKSFIIIAKQSLFEHENDDDDDQEQKWNLLCFYSKDEKEKTKWETKYLLNEIKDKMNDISDSNLFKNDFFKILENNEMIEIYTNLQDFQDSQIVFTKIISSFFLIDKNNDSLYSNILDGSIISSFYYTYKNNTEISQTIERLIYGETYEESKYLKNHPEALKSIKIIMDIYKKRKSEFTSPKSFIDDLRDKKDYLEEKEGKNFHIDSMIFTVTLVKRFVIMILRIILNQPLILEGFTGVGKTAALHLLNVLFELVGDSLGWAFYQIDCHGDLLFDNIQKDVIQKNLDNSTRKGCHNHIFFFDELNTSPGSCCVINYMNNFGMVQKLTKEEDKLTFIAAINPYIEVDKTTRDLSRVGIKQFIPKKISKLRLCQLAPKDRSEYYEIPDLNKLAYNVRELSESTKTIILKSDPELFLLNEIDENATFLPPDEKAVIKNMITQYYDSLYDLIYIESQGWKVENFDDNDFISSFKKYRNDTIQIIFDLICESFLCIRGLMILRSILSYRDVKRFMMHFLNFLRKDIKHYAKETKNIDKDKIPEFIKSKVIPDSIVYSLMLSIVFRFSSHTKIAKSEKNELKRRCKLLNFNLIMKEDDEDFVILDISSSLLNRLYKVEWHEITKPEINDWNKKIITDFSDKLFTKYANMDGIFHVKSLVIHLFAITSCFSVSRHFPDEPIMPCLIIGMPGTSKTLAIQLFTQHKMNKENFYSTTYLSTRASEADGLNAHYRDCAMFMIEKEAQHKGKDENYTPMAICIIDELGLANLNETRPLKLLHYYFDKGIAMKYNDDNLYTEEKESRIFHVMSIAASNYALDFANMNRGILICTDLPSDDDIALSFPLEQQEQVKDFLSALWELTSNKKRPEMLALRPLYLLYNILFVEDSRKFSDVCVYLTSVVSCHPSEAPEKASLLIKKLKKTKKTKNIDKKEFIMSEIIEDFISEEFLTRALCIRTKNYDCLDFIEKLIRKISKRKSMKPIFTHIYPTDFKLPSHVCADHALKEIFQLLTKKNTSSNKKNLFMIIGNASFSDSLLDLLNVPFKNKGQFDMGESSLISQNGFSIRLNAIPQNFKLIFIINDEDFERKNSINAFPIPLLDRFDQIYFDYNSTDEFKVVEDYSSTRENYLDYKISDCQHIHQYFKHFIDTLNEVKPSTGKKKIPVIIVEETEDEHLPQKFVNNSDTSDLFKAYLYKHDPNLNPGNKKRIIGKFRQKENEEDRYMIENTRVNFKNLKVTFKNTYFANHCRNNFYELEDHEKSHPIRDSLFKFHIESYNGSIVGLKQYMNKENDEVESIQAMVFTLSPMMEALKDINKENSVIVYDQYVQSAKSLEEKIYEEMTDQTEYVIIQSNQFSGGSKSLSKALVHDRHIRYILENLEVDEKVNIIIIYHLKDSKIPENLEPSINWPMFWIESVSDSPLDANDSNRITNCILFRKEYKNNYDELARNMFDQLYLDLWTSYNIILPHSSDNSYKKKNSKRRKRTEHNDDGDDDDDIENNDDDDEDDRAVKKFKRSKKPKKSKIDVKADKSKNDKKQVKMYPKLIDQRKIEIFKEIISNEKRIADEKEKEEDFDDTVFRSLFDSLKDDKTYLEIDLKRLFYEKLKNHLPSYLSFFIKLLISNTPKINEDNSYLNFISNLYESNFIQRNFNRYFANQFQPFQVDQKAPYFPELILEQVLILYDQKYTGSICEVFEYIGQYIDLQIEKEKIVEKYIEYYFIPFLTKTSHKDKDIDKIDQKANDFYKSFELLLLLRGGYMAEPNYDSFHKHLSKFERKIQPNFSYQNYLTFSMMDDQPLIQDEKIRKLMKSNNNLLNIFYKYQLLTDVCDLSKSSTSIQKDEISSSISVELTQMIVLGRPFMDNDIPIIDYISKVDKDADDYIFKRKSFINLIYYEKLIEYLRGNRKSSFEIQHDDNFFNHHYVFPEDAFNIIDVQVEEIPESDLAIIGDVDTTEFTPQLFKEHSIFQKTYELIKSIEFPTFKTSSKSYLKTYTDIVYPHEMIRSNILHNFEYSTESFSEWLFDTDAPLFVRQLYATFNSIKSKNDDEIIREFTVLSLLLNPWNKDPTTVLLFWNFVNENIKIFIPKEEDKSDNYSQISQSIQKAFEKMKWCRSLQEGTVFYIFDKKVLKPRFIYEINYQIDHLIYSIAISNKSCTEFVKYSNMFKSLPYVNLIKEIPVILTFSEFLQKKFIKELDALFVILNTLNCEELTRIGDEMKGISLYNEIQSCIENNESLLDENKGNLKQNQIKNLLIKINKAFPGLSAYEQINLYTHKIVDFYNNVFNGFYNTEIIKFSQVQLSSLFTNFNIKQTIVLTSFMITYDTGNEINCTIDVNNFLNKAFSYKTKFNNRGKINMNTIFPKSVKLINYASDSDFLGFKIGHFSNSIFSNIDLKEVEMNMEYFIKVQKKDPLYREKCLAMAVCCRPYPDDAAGDAFDALAYLLVILSRSSEKVDENDDKRKFLFYDIANNNKSRINQVIENLRSLESNVDFRKTRVHIKGQKIIKEVMKRIVPKEIQNSEEF